MTIGLLALFTMPVWMFQIHEFLKPKEQQNNKKIVLLTSLGSLMTTIITISLIQDFLS
ncbi:hypothetical protein ACI2JA_10695 [Alkalihalobacillus sp. NPDC078783]